MPNTSKTLPGGYSLLALGDDGSETRYAFEPAKNRPFGYYVASAGQGDRLVKVERRVFSVEKEGVLLPSGVVDVVSLGLEGGYTEVVMLELEPLEIDSPIGSEITPASFQDIGIGHQVYKCLHFEGVEIAERYEKPAMVFRNTRNDLARSSSGQTRSWL